MAHTRPTFNVSVATHYGPDNSKTFWTNIGSAWPNKKGGFFVSLKALPVNGELHLFPVTEKEETSS